MKRKIFKFLKITFYALVVITGIFAIFYLYTSGPWQVPQTVAQDTSIPHITVDEVVFHSESFGADSYRTLVVVHGGPGQDYRYLLPIKELADEYRVVFYDQRGTGLSPRVDPSELTLQNSIEDLNRIIDYYSPQEKVNILGHSWGAMLASAYLGKHPNRVHKIILAEPGFLTTEMSKIFEQRTNGFKVEMNPTNMLLIGKVVMRGLHVRGPDDQAVKDYIYSNLVTANIEDHPMAGYFCGGKYDSTQVVFWRLSMEAARSIPGSQTDAEGNIQVDLVKGVEQYEDTVLFISGECNVFIGPDFQKKHLRHFPRHKMVVIEDAGHNMFMDQPAAFFSVVRSYLRN